jgi:hypothetical protein
MMSRQPLRWIGERSYGIYLWHWPVFMLLRPGIDLDPTARGAVHASRLGLALAELPYRRRDADPPRSHRSRLARWEFMLLLVGRSAVALVTHHRRRRAPGLANAHEPTLEDALGGLQGIGDEDLTPLPTTPAPAPSGSVSASPGTSKPPKPPGPPKLKAGEDAYGLSVTAVGDSVLRRRARRAVDPCQVTGRRPVSLQSSAVSSGSGTVVRPLSSATPSSSHTGTNGIVDSASCRSPDAAEGSFA